MADNENQAREEQIFRGKEIAFFQEFLAAWIGTRMEFDKQMLIISGLAIGLLAQYDERLAQGLWATGLWMAAAIGFLVTIVLVLWILRVNTDHIGLLLEEEYPEDLSKKADTSNLLSLWARWMFGGAIVLTVFMIMLEIPLLGEFFGIESGLKGGQK